jgi:hypothetical protein
VASLTVGSNYSLTDCCDKSSGLGNAGCYAALVLRGGLVSPADVLCLTASL